MTGTITALRAGAELQSPVPVRAEDVSGLPGTSHPPPNCLSARRRAPPRPSLTAGPMRPPMTTSRGRNGLRPYPVRRRAHR